MLPFGRSVDRIYNSTWLCVPALWKDLCWWHLMKTDAQHNEKNTFSNVVRVRTLNHHESLLPSRIFCSSKMWTRFCINGESAPHFLIFIDAKYSMMFGLRKRKECVSTHTRSIQISINPMLNAPRRRNSRWDIKKKSSEYNHLFWSWFNHLFNFDSIGHCKSTETLLTLSLSVVWNEWVKARGEHSLAVSTVSEFRFFRIIFSWSRLTQTDVALQLSASS
jgi:hypothetical protein